MSRSANALSGLAGAGKFTELRSRLLFVLGALIVYRITPKQVRYMQAWALESYEVQLNN